MFWSDCDAELMSSLLLFWSLLKAQKYSGGIELCYYHDSTSEYMSGKIEKAKMINRLIDKKANRYLCVVLSLIYYDLRIDNRPSCTCTNMGGD